MKPLSRLLDGWVSPADCPEVSVDGLVLDSRQLKPGQAFVALSGARAHGLTFADQARARGAGAILCDRPDAARDVLTVPDLKQRLPELARRMWDDPAADLVLHGITGTNGKSSCAWLLAQATGGAMIGTLGAGRPGRLAAGTHTTPDILSLYRTLAGLRDAGFKHVAMEVSSHALAQDRIAGLSFASTAFTNLSHDHLDYHASRDEYGATKARLFLDWPSEIRLINIDDAFGAQLAERLHDRPGLVRYGLSPRAQLRAEIIASTLDGLRLRIHEGTDAIEARSALIGDFNASNLLVVAGVLRHLGRDWNDIAAHLERLTPVPGRMNRLPATPGQPDVVVDYAHSPDALQRALSVLKPLVRGALICVFGCGGERDRAKRPLMGAIAERLAQRVVLTDDNPRGEDGLAIIREIQAGMERPAAGPVIRDRAQAIARAVHDAGPGDLVLVAGKGHEAEQVIGDERRPFSDFEAVRAALENAA